MARFTLIETTNVNTKYWQWCAWFTVWGVQLWYGSSHSSHILQSYSSVLDQARTFSSVRNAIRYHMGITKIYYLFSSQIVLFWNDFSIQSTLYCHIHVRFTTCGTIQSPPMKMLSSFVLILHSVNAVKIYIANLNHYKNYDQQENGLHMEEDHATNHLHHWWMSMFWQRYIWNDVVKHQNHKTMASEFQKCLVHNLYNGSKTHRPWFR